MGKLKAKTMIRNQLPDFATALWVSNSISGYYYFQQVLVKLFTKSSITENPRCTRHRRLDSGSWSPARMRLRLLTAPHQAEPSSTLTQAPWFIHYKTWAEVGQNSRSAQPSLQKCFSSGLTLAQPLAKFRKKHVLSPKMAQNSCNNVKTLRSPVSGNGILIYADLEIMFLI